MQTHIILDTKSYPDCTIGRMWCGQFTCFTLELPWLGNQQDISCIPNGIYRWKKRMSPNKGYEVIELIDVPNRQFIQIHIGNRTSQILGCVLTGEAIKDYNDDGIPDVVNSKDAFETLMSITADEGTIEIRGDRE